MIIEGEAKIVPRWEWRTLTLLSMPLQFGLRRHLSKWPRTRVLKSIYYGSVARKMQRFEMVFLTSNVCIKSMSVVLNCGNRCSRPNSRLVKTMLRQLLSNGSYRFPDLAEKPTRSTNSLMN